MGPHVLSPASGPAQARTGSLDASAPRNTPRQATLSSRTFLVSRTQRGSGLLFLVVELVLGFGRLLVVEFVLGLGLLLVAQLGFRLGRFLVAEFGLGLDLFLLGFGF